MFDKEKLESFKYADLVKVAKEHDVYRRYAPKIELIEKLLAKSEPVVETLNDVSMPSFMQEDESESEEIDSEGVMPLTELNSEDVYVKEKVVKGVSSPCAPLIDKNKTGNPQILRKSLAGPPKPTFNSRRTKREISSETGEKTEKENEKSEISARRATRQRTFNSPDKGNGNKRQCMKRDGTYGVDDEGISNVTRGKRLKREVTFEVLDETVNSGSCVEGSTPVPQKMRREGTFEVKEHTSEELTGNRESQRLKREGTFEVKEHTSELTGNRDSQRLRREGTFEVKENVPHQIDSSHFRRLRREGTFEVENTSASKIDQLALKPKLTPRTSSKRISDMKQAARMSRGSPHQPKRISVSTPSSVKPLPPHSAQSVPRRFITSRNRTIDLASPAPLSKIPSVINEIEKKKAEVSVKKVEAILNGKPVVGKKAPDFNAIHKRLFGRMESLVDSKQKVINKANSVQKNWLGRQSPPKGKVVRKLLSPKAGIPKLLSPKPTLPRIASSYASNVVSIQKRPSIGSSIPGIAKLQLPAPKITPKVNAATAASSNFGFKKVEPTRKDALKASVLGRKPVKRNSPMAKAKQALQTVRLNKRFELQMKHRLAQQTSN